MITLFAIIFIFIVCIFLLAPLMWLACGRIFKINELTFKKVFATYLIVVAIGIMFQILTYILGKSGVSHLFIEFLISLASAIIIIRIIKGNFETTIPRSIGFYLLQMICLVAIALFVRTYVFQAFKIPSPTMKPTLQIGDHIWADKFIYQFNKPERGDIIIFPFPENPKKQFIKRVVAVSGDKVEMRNNELYLNNQKLDEDFIVHHDLNKQKHAKDNFGPIVVPDNALFVLGDNRDHSYDSRFWGFVDINTVIGKAQSIYWSYSRENSQVRWNRIGKSIK
ncbi:signal peptidase I [Desulfococcaceae bacterium HSG7]|nr:signal peptidase I [Desulfococcaceae bacterium HSG7]